MSDTPRVVSIADRQEIERQAREARAKAERLELRLQQVKIEERRQQNINERPFRVECPCCGDPGIGHIVRPPKFWTNILLAIFVFIFTPPGLNIILALWGFYAAFTPKRLWHCEVCEWEGHAIGWALFRRRIGLAILGVLIFALLLYTGRLFTP